MAKSAKTSIGLKETVVYKTKHKRRSLPKPRRHSKSLGPKDSMRGDRGRH